MAKPKSDFRDDRDWNTPPDFDAPLEEKIAYSRWLRKKWDNLPELPSAILDMPMPDPDKPWTHPEWVTESYQRRRIR
jgi:hypothetical protein